MKTFVNGNQVHVTKNLHEDLSNIKDQYETPALWIDQICIDQRDNNERRRQVGLMTTIYGRARTVHVWPGNHLAPRWVENIRTIDCLVGWAVSQASTYPASGNYWLYRLSEEEYWKRIWIVQKVGMASYI
jgi:hypothetical protein